MSLTTVMAIALGLSLTAYAIFAGADFGAGVLDLTSGPRREQRRALARTIGPLWEANHVWLIFSITILFSTFPPAFAALGTVMLAPVTLAVMAIVVRGAAFGLRGDAAGDAAGDRLLGFAFGAASVAAPFLFGASAAALAEVSTSARVRATPTSVPWTGVFAVTVGVLAVALCAHLAASFTTNRLARTGHSLIAEDFRRRALRTGAAVVVLGGLALLAAAWKAPALWHRLSTEAWPLLATAAVAMAGSLYGIARRHYLLARSCTMLVAAAVLWGWFLAQSPRLVGAQLTTHTAAATPAALTAIAIAGGVVLLAVIPAFYLLYVLFGRPSSEVTP
jgi:cytochrome d ubiquinol oxidase subunit II